MAGWLPLFAAAATGGPAGFSQVNTDDVVFAGGVLNAFDTANQTSLDGGATPAQIDANGLPSATLTSGQSIAYALKFSDDQTGSGTQWTFEWTPSGTGTLDLRFDSASFGSVSATGCSVTSGPTISMTGGTPASVTFNWTGLPGQNFVIRFMAGAWGSGSPKPILCRTSDRAAITAGRYFTPELISLYQGLNLKTIRGFPWQHSIELNNNNVATWATRAPITGIAWKGPRWFPTLWAGDSTGTDQYTVSRPSGISTSDWVDGETIQANLTNASTSYYIATNATNNGSGLIRITVPSTTGLTTGQKVYLSNFNGTTEANAVWAITVINSTTFDLQGSTFTNTYTGGASFVSVQTLTVTGKTNGTKNIAYYNMSAIQAGTPIAAGNSTLVYNRAMDVLLWKINGVTENVPIEAMIDLANRLTVNIWLTVPNMANDGFVSSMTSLVASSLGAGQSFYIEYSNETWNSGSPQYAFSTIIGNYLFGGGAPGWTGLRASQVFTLAQTAWASAGKSRSLLRNTLMWQAFGGTSDIQFYLFNGSILDPTSNTRLQAYLGGTTPNFSTTGNRPIDLADVVGYADYFSGTVFKSGLFNYGYPQTSYVVAKLQAWATALNSDPNDSTTLAAMDFDQRYGVYDTKTISSVSTTTINATANGLNNNDWIMFTTTGTLPSPLQPFTLYYVVSAATNSFSASTTRGGSAISLTGGSGTHTVNNLSDVNYGNQSLLILSSVIYNAVNGGYGAGNWENLVASYDSARAGFGKSPLRVEQYEGALEAAPPSASTCTTLGVTVGGSGATAAAALLAGWTNYRNNALAKALAQAKLKQFMGTDSSAPTFGLMTHSKTPSWFIVGGPSQWSLLSGPVGSAPFQMYAGVAEFVGVAN